MNTTWKSKVNKLIVNVILIFKNIVQSKGKGEFTDEIDSKQSYGMFRLIAECVWCEIENTLVDFMCIYIFLYLVFCLDSVFLVLEEHFFVSLESVEYYYNSSRINE